MLDTLGAPVEQDGHFLPASSILDTVMTALAVPLWATTVLPLTIVYQLGSALLNPLLKQNNNKDDEHDFKKKIDSGYVVDASEIIPCERRKYDVILLGATGFTGALGVRYLAQTYGVNKTVKWAIAGRSQAKLDQLKRDLAKELDLEDLLLVDTVLVDTSTPATLPRLVRDTRVVATTAGPFAEYGNHVVEFCAKFGTHYVDITGETDWALTMMLHWESTAQKTNAKIISLCGHDSVPWDLTVFKLREALQEKNKDETLESVSCWNLIVSKPSGGTMETMSLFLSGKSSKLPNYKFHPALKLPNGEKSPFHATSDLPFRPSKVAPINALRSSYTTPAVMAGVNFDVVKRSNALAPMGSPTLLYREASLSPDLKTTFVGYAQLIMFFSAMLNPLTRSLLRRYGLPQPGEGASLNFMNHVGFLCVKGEGIGSKGSIAETSLYFPKDPGYMETARMLVESALCLALQGDQLPSPQGGFWTPASGLGNVLLNRLCQTGTYFQSRVKSGRTR
jgi:short subunit dehydrogenase-like uncharacterized protein